MKYTPTDLNSKITHFASSIQFQKEANLLVDFVINDDICVYVRRVDEYMKQPTFMLFWCIIGREVDRLLERQKKREEQYGHPFILRIFILILDNLASNERVIEELSAKCAYSELSLLLCWSVSEAGSLINEIKLYERRGANLIQKNVGKDIRTQAMNVLTSIDSINVTDLNVVNGQKDNAALLMNKYATMADIMTSQLSELEELPGIGTHRVLDLFKAFQQVKETE